MIITTKVQLNDIFQPESEELINERIDYALHKEGEGKNFWKHFFLCDNPICADDGVITYLFTEQQLGILRDWWDFHTGETCENQILKNNLLRSKRTYLERPRHFRNTKILPVYACYITNYKSARYPKAVRLIFGRSRAEDLPKNCIDFFGENEKFSITMEEFSPEGQINIFIGLVINLRPIIDLIVKKFRIRNRIIELKSGIYFLFLGNYYGTHQWLKYCKDMNPDCPLVIKRATRTTSKIAGNAQGAQGNVVQGNIL